jgi:hypothetical protein
VHFAFSGSSPAEALTVESRKPLTTESLGRILDEMIQNAV